MPKKKAARPQSLWERIKEGMATIGEMADSLTKKKKPAKKPVTGRVKRGPVRPQVSPEQQEYLDRQKEKK